MRRGKGLLAVLVTTFIVLTASIAVLFLTAEGAFTASPFRPHPPLQVSPATLGGTAGMFSTETGIARGAGTESDPYVIEGWEITAGQEPGITVRDTDAHLVIRNSSVSSSSMSSIGIMIVNASNVRVESVFVSGCGIGVLVDGGAGHAASINMTSCTLQSNTEHVVLMNASDCVVDHSVLAWCNGRAFRAENCSSVALRYNGIYRFALPGQPLYDWAPSVSGGALLVIANVTGCSVEENELVPTQDGLDGARVVDSQDVAFVRNGFDCGTGHALLVTASAQVLVSHNTVSDGRGISVTGCSDVTVDGNLLRMTTDRRTSALYAPGVSVSGSLRAVVSENDLVGAGGVYIGGSADCLVARNHVEEAGSQTQDAVDGIFLHMSSNVTVSRNTLRSCNGVGIYLSASAENVTVEGNDLRDNLGMHDQYWFDQAGGLLAYGANLTIRENRLSNNTVPDPYPRGHPGLWVQCRDSVIESNNISDAVEVSYSDNLTLHHNTFQGGGIEVDASVSGIGPSVTFIENNFANGTHVTLYEVPNATRWDAGYPEGGNFWSEYTGEDLMSGPGQDVPGSDGLGDTPYTGAPDRYPRMTPVSVDDRLPPTTCAVMNGTLGERTWFTSNVSVALISYDIWTSVANIEYTLDSEQWQTYASDVTVSGDGEHLLVFKAVDGLGNAEEEESVEIRIDTRAPYLVSSLEQEYHFRTKSTAIGYIQAEFADDGSGFGRSYATYDLEWYPATAYASGGWVRLPLEDGVFETTIYAVDLAGNLFSHDVSVSAIVRPVTDPLSKEGPYGQWLMIVLMLADVGVGVAALDVYLRMRAPSQPVPMRWRSREEAEKHYDEEVVDGYPHFKRKV